MKYQLVNFKFYLQLIQELIYFIKNPKLIIEEKKPVKRKILETIGLFIIKMAVSIVIALLLGLLYEPKNITSSNMIARFTPLLYLFVGGVILPTFEEITFRLSLKFNSFYASLSLTTMTYYLLTKVVYRTNLSLVDDSFKNRVFFAVIIGLVSYLILNRNIIKHKAIAFWKHNFRYIYYASCILFAWLHIFNFEINTLNVLLLPVLTLPQFFSATIAGYTRIAFGFQYPLIIHMVTNTIFISLTFLPID